MVVVNYHRSACERCGMLLVADSRVIKSPSGRYYCWSVCASAAEGPQLTPERWEYKTETFSWESSSAEREGFLVL
jgi:hypothetical protein